MKVSLYLLFHKLVVMGEPFKGEQPTLIYTQLLMNYHSRPYDWVPQIISSWWAQMLVSESCFVLLNTIKCLYFCLHLCIHTCCPSLTKFHWLLSRFKREPPFWSSRMWDESWFTHRCAKVNHLKQLYSSAWRCWARYFRFTCYYIPLGIV